MQQAWKCEAWPLATSQMAAIGSRPAVGLIDLDGGIDFSDEGCRADVAESPAHQAKSAGEQRHVAEVEGRLEEAVHPEISPRFSLDSTIGVRFFVVQVCHWPELDEFD